MKKLACTIALAVLVSSAGHRAWSQSAGAYPTRPVRLIIGFAPGDGLQEITLRPVSQWLSARLGQPFIIENRPGAIGNIATEVVVHAAADGYTLLITTGSNATSATFFDNLSFNFIRDITPVAGIVRTPIVIEVNPSIPVKTIPEFIAFAKANPGTVNYATPGSGSTNHLTGELFNMKTGIKMVHVPYRGIAPAQMDLLGGQVQVMFDNLPSSAEYVRTGRLRALAVMTATRSPVLPDIPSVSEFVPGLETSIWLGVGAPKDTPPEIVEKLNKEINSALADPKIKARLAEVGGTAFVISPAEFGKFIADETDKWAKVIRAANIKP
jgi:tripartite-type tricarboxylate transporter receptor subunit TctC